MQVTPEWVAVVLTLMTMSGGAGVWIERRLTERRQAMPIVRAEWTVGAQGHAARITLVNRLNEDIRVERIEARAVLLEQVSVYDPSLSKVESTLTPRSASMPLDWLIPAGGTASETFRIEGAATERWLRLTLSSSSRTLRSRRVTVRDSRAA